MSESIHKKLDRVRKPRVHITYEVETEGAVVQKELPFVVGVIGDFSGNPTSPLKPLKDRNFIAIDRDSFDDVMKRMTPGLNMRVENTLKGDGSEMPVQLKFNSMDDFSPINVANQVEPLRKLLETRDRLRDLLAKIDRSEDLENILEKVLKNTEDLKKLSAELGIETPQ
jgi:type VI secretion system protein ImpB